MPVRAYSDRHIPLFCRLKIGIDLLPVHNIPPGRDVGRPQIAVPVDTHTETLSTCKLHLLVMHEGACDIRSQTIALLLGQENYRNAARTHAAASPKECWEEMI